MVVIEDYVSFEIAKQLKEKGFDVLCTAHWFIGTDRTFNISNYPQNWNAMKTDLDWVSCPTLQMAASWLRNKYGYFISIDVEVGEIETKQNTWEETILGYNFNIFDENHINWIYLGSKRFQLPEEACEAGIKFCLENLIK